MIVAKLKSNTLQNPETMEIGLFETVVEIPDNIWALESDKRGAIKAAIARKLAVIVFEFKISPEVFTIYYPYAIQVAFNLPASQALESPT